jgi:dolichol-phosphate mannosyltransferase
VDHVLRLRESDPYLRGLTVWLGLNQAFVPYERHARHAGRTHFPFFSRNPWKTFVLGATSFSFFPIYVCAVLAAAGLAVAGLTLIVALMLAIEGTPMAARIGLIGLLTFFWASTVGAIAIVGLYVARVYKDVRGRPLYVLESTIGLSEADSHENDVPASREAALKR